MDAFKEKVGQIFSQARVCRMWQSSKARGSRETRPGQPGNTDALHRHSLRGCRARVQKTVSTRSAGGKQGEPVQGGRGIGNSPQHAQPHHGRTGHQSGGSSRRAQASATQRTSYIWSGTPGQSPGLITPREHADNSAEQRSTHRDSERGLPGIGRTRTCSTSTARCCGAATGFTSTRLCAPCEHVTGFEVSLEGVALAGNTDTGILREACALAGIPADVLEPQVAAILEGMCSNVAGRRHELDLVLMPGVQETLRHLAQIGRDPRCGHRQSGDDWLDQDGASWAAGVVSLWRIQRPLPCSIRAGWRCCEQGTRTGGPAGDESAWWETRRETSKRHTPMGCR